MIHLSVNNERTLSSLFSLNVSEGRPDVTFQKQLLLLSAGDELLFSKASDLSVSSLVLQEGNKPMTFMIKVSERSSLLMLVRVAPFKTELDGFIYPPNSLCSATIRAGRDIGVPLVSTHAEGVLYPNGCYLISERGPDTIMLKLLRASDEQEAA
jgi:hypothetical protein